MHITYIVLLRESAATNAASSALSTLSVGVRITILTLRLPPPFKPPYACSCAVLLPLPDHCVAPTFHHYNAQQTTTTECYSADVKIRSWGECWRGRATAYTGERESDWERYCEGVQARASAQWIVQNSSLGVHLRKGGRPIPTVGTRHLNHNASSPLIMRLLHDTPLQACDGTLSRTPSWSSFTSPSTTTSIPTSLPGLKTAPPLNPWPRHRHDDARVGSAGKVNGDQSPGYVRGTEYSITICCLVPTMKHNQFSTLTQPT